MRHPIHLDSLKYQIELLFYNLFITNVLSTYFLFEAPVFFKKITNEVQKIAPTQLTDQHIRVDQSIQFGNRTGRLFAQLCV